MNTETWKWHVLVFTRWIPLSPYFSLANADHMVCFWYSPGEYHWHLLYHWLMLITWYVFGIHLVDTTNTLKYLEIVYGKFQWCCFRCRIIYYIGLPQLLWDPSLLAVPLPILYESFIGFLQSFPSLLLILLFDYLSLLLFFSYSTWLVSSCSAQNFFTRSVDLVFSWWYFSASSSTKIFYKNSLYVAFRVFLLFVSSYVEAGDKTRIVIPPPL